MTDSSQIQNTMFKSSILTNQHIPFVLFQSSPSRSALPIVRWLIESQRSKDSLVLLSLLYPPTFLLPSTEDETNVFLLDWTEYVPGYKEHSYDAKISEVRDAVERCSSSTCSHCFVTKNWSSPGYLGPLTIVIDSADTLCDDLESTSVAFSFIASIYSLLNSRKGK